jgi:hypothetical protein
LPSFAAKHKLDPAFKKSQLLIMTDNTTKKSGNGIGIGAALGVAFGAAYGISSGNTSLSIAMGLAIGVAVGAIFDIVKHRN